MMECVEYSRFHARPIVHRHIDILETIETAFLNSTARLPAEKTRDLKTTECCPNSQSTEVAVASFPHHTTVRTGPNTAVRLVERGRESTLGSPKQVRNVVRKTRCKYRG